MTAEPTPGGQAQDTAAAVLTEHALDRDVIDGILGCTKCAWVATVKPSTGEDWAQGGAHQAAMLAAAGLLPAAPPAPEELREAVASTLPPAATPDPSAPQQRAATTPATRR